MKRWGRVAFTVASGLLTMLMPIAAQAFTYPATPPGEFGRAEFNGYFTNVNHTCGDSILYNGLGFDRATNVFTPGYGLAGFLQDIHDALFLAPVGQDRTGAAFIILTMEGVQGPAAGGSAANGVIKAKALYNKWASQVTYYASIPGKVTWNTPMTFPYDGTSTYLNTLYMGRDNCSGPPIPPDTRVPNDVAFFVDNTVQTKPTIIFHNSDGTRFMIKRNCANPIGEIEPLTDGAFSYNPTLGITGATPPPGTIVQAGDVLTLSAAFHNAGTILGPNGTLGYYSKYTPGATSAETVLGVNPPVGAGANSANYPFSFTVSAAATNGTQVCVTSRVSPHTTDVAPFDSADSVPLCWSVQNPRFPSVVGNNGDIHAGGGLCGGTPAPAGPIKGFPGAGSGGQYVVSASAAGISNFTSNGAGADSLKLGQNGGYLQVCRPDLLKAAKAYQSAGMGWAGISGSRDVGSTNPVSGLDPAYDVYFANGPIQLHGTVNRKITIVSLSGLVEIDNPITLDLTARPRASQPSLGIIANGDIDINPSVTRVDAYLFADGAIDTCRLGAGSCSNTLTVNGFMMAQDLILHRLGTLNAQGKVPGEVVNLNTEIYLNPPTLFDASVDNILLEGQGESQPLF